MKIIFRKRWPRRRPFKQSSQPVRCLIVGSRLVDGWRSWMFGAYWIGLASGPKLVLRFGPCAVEFHATRSVS